MPKGTIFRDNKGIQRSFRKSLSEIQLSADEERLVRNMLCSEDKVSVIHPKTAVKVITAEKENAPAVRRSKRKTAIEKTYVESPLDIKPSKSKNTQGKKTATKSKKGRSVASKKNEPQTANQTKLNFSPVRIDLPKENACVSESDNTEKNIQITEVTDDDSGFDPAGGTVDHSPMNSTVILRTPHVKSSTAMPDLSIIMAASPPLSYWKDLAEQRQVALEKALHENELLHDQLTVLEAENYQLKQLLKEAENLAQVVRAIVN